MNKVQDANFTPKAKRVLEVAKQRCLENNFTEITDEFLLHAVLFSDSLIVNLAFQAVKLDIKDIIIGLSKTLPFCKKKLPNENISFSKDSAAIIAKAYDISKEFNQNYTDVAHLFLAILRSSTVVKKFFKKNSIDVGFICDKVENECKIISNPTKKLVQKTDQQQQSASSAFYVNFTEKAAAGHFDQIFFRSKEVDQMSEILCRKQKSNPILIGEAGVGKSAIVGLIAKKINECDCTEFLVGKTVLQLDLGALIAGTKLRGEFEERLMKVMNEIKNMKNVILFIDEIHNVIGMGNDAGSMDAANIITPFLTEGEISFVGATTQKEYEKYFQKDSAMNRRFEPVFVREPTKDETFEILKNLKEFYEKFHMILYPDNVLQDIVTVCEKYMSSKRFPDKAIDLMDQVGAKVKIRAYARPEDIKNTERLIVEFEKLAPDDVKADHLAEIICDYEMKCEEWAKTIKNKKVKVKQKDVYSALSDKIGQVIDNSGDNEGIKNILGNLKNHVFGQDEALKKISDCVLRSSFGLSKDSRPLGNFMFIGPTGSGKTHLAKTLAKQAFGSDANLCTLDMSEFMESASVSKLIGSPPGYVGHGNWSVLATQLEKFPSSVFLFDEIEKAHPDVANILLQIMDSGKLTDSTGRALNFKNCIIILTGNVGFQFSDNKRMGFGAASAPRPVKENVLDNLRKSFRPEFLARLNEIVIFDELSSESLVKIVETELSQISESLKKNNTSISFDKSVSDFIIAQTKDSNTGARKVIFFIENELKSKIVDILSTSTYNQIKVCIKENKISVDGKTKKFFAVCGKK